MPINCIHFPFNHILKLIKAPCQKKVMPIYDGGLVASAMRFGQASS